MEQRRCEYCGEPIDPIKSEEEIDVSIRGVEVKVKINVIKCNHCGEEIYDRDNEIKNDRIVFDAYKKAIGLLTSEDIIKIRKKYGLSAESFAKLLGLGDKAFERVVIN